MEITHPLLPYTVVIDGLQVYRRESNGSVVAATTTDALLAIALHEIAELKARFPVINHELLIEATAPIFPPVEEPKGCEDGLCPVVKKVNLNTADAEAIAALPLLGEASAQKLVEARPFENLEEALSKTKLRLGKNAIAELKDLVEF